MPPREICVWNRGATELSSVVTTGGKHTGGPAGSSADALPGVCSAALRKLFSQKEIRTDTTDREPSVRSRDPHSAESLSPPG